MLLHYSTVRDEETKWNYLWLLTKQMGIFYLTSSELEIHVIRFLFLKVGSGISKKFCFITFLECFLYLKFGFSTTKFILISFTTFLEHLVFKSNFQNRSKRKNKQKTTSLYFPSLILWTLVKILFVFNSVNWLFI